MFFVRRQLVEFNGQQETAPLPGMLGPGSPRPAKDLAGNAPPTRTNFENRLERTNRKYGKEISPYKPENSTSSHQVWSTPVLNSGMWVFRAAAWRAQMIVSRVWAGSMMASSQSRAAA